MTIEPAAPKSRRSLLIAGLGGLLGAAAAAMGRPAPTRAADGGSIILGQSNTSTVPTFVHNSSGGTVFVAETLGGSGIALEGEAVAGAGVHGTTSSGSGVFGESESGYGVDGHSGTSYGVHGSSDSSAAIYGESTSHPGVVGHSDNTIGVSGVSPNGSGVAGSSGIGVGVVGTSNATDQAGIRGSTGGDATGVMGYSGSALPATAPAKTGVYGEAAQDSTAKGVWGKSNSGRGVYGQAGSGQGVRGYATTGAAIFGSTAGLKKGLALRTVGRVRFDNSVGTATIPSGQKSVVVTPGIDLLSTSTVVATIQGNPSGTMTVRSVAVDATADTFTIYLTANATVTMTVAWHVFG